MKKELPERAFILLDVVDVCNALRLFASTHDERHLERMKRRLFRLYEKQLAAGGVVPNVSFDEFWSINFMRRGQKGKRSVA